MKNRIDDRITVLHIIQAPGGVERYIRSFLKYINHTKVCNILVCSQDYNRDNYKELADEFLNVSMTREVCIKTDVLAIFCLRKIIKKYKPDIVYCHSSKAGAVGRIANLFKRNVCIYNPHGWAFNMRGSAKKQKFYVFVEKMLAKCTDKIVCISQAEQDSSNRRHICKESKTIVIDNGIDFEEYDVIKENEITRKQLEIPEDVFVVGVTGRLSEQKAPDIFAKAAVEISKVVPNAYFLMVGEGEQHEKTVSCFEENGLAGRYKITGWVDNPMQYIRLFDVALLLSRWEGFGLVLPEYMLAEKPIVATNVDAIPYVVRDNVNGLLVEMDDYQAVCRQVVRIYNDQDLRRCLVEEGKKIVHEKFDARRVSKEHLDLFMSLEKRRKK